MRYDISLLIPSIRPVQLEKLYNSISKSFHGKWEVIFVSPYPLPKDLEQYDNIQYVRSFMSPIACRQMALTLAKGDYICYAADDLLFFENSLDIAFHTLKGKDYKTIVVGKYLEGTNYTTDMHGNEYWKLAYHDALRNIMKTLPKDYLLINTGLVSRTMMLEIGGWDCQFDVCAIACVDLSLRLQKNGAICILQNEPIFFSSHLPGDQGDHAPIHYAQLQHDFPLLEDIWLREESKERVKVDIENWKGVSERWARRFGAKA